MGRLSIKAAAVVALTASSTLALPSNSHVLHEARNPTPVGESNTHHQWKRGNRVHSEAIIPLRIGLTQSNLHMGYDKLMSVSSPDSGHFGKHLTEGEVNALFAPADDTFAAVHSWLVDMGIDPSEIRQYTNKGWLAMDVPVSKAEELFQTQYHEHEQDGAIRIGCDLYHVPKHLSQHIDYIVPGVKMSPVMVKRSVEGRSLEKRINPQNKKNWRPKKIPPHEASWKPSPPSSLPLDLQDCARNFTAVCYRALYNIPSISIPVPGHQPAVYEIGDTYSQDDLNSYFHKYTPYIRNGTHPTLQSVDGAQAPVSADSAQNGGESDIDIDIVQSLVWPQSMMLYQVDDIYYSTQSSLAGFLNTFLDALDGSYCHKTDFGITGDSPGIDPSYPDSHPGGYKKPEMCGAYKPAHVISISYGESELDVPKNYLQRQCNEFLKLGLQGTTVLVSSGDYGVGIGPGANACLNGTGQTNTIYNPGNPVACPYLTAVGATQLNPGTTVKDAEAALQTPLGPGSELFATGGGFSNYFPVPDYQKAAVQSYFSKHDPGHPYYVANAAASNIGENGGLYNRAGRGIPDISANGANFRAFTNGTNFHWFGTSLAAPLWNAIITLINQERALIGKKPVGFINPVLYKNTAALTDITLGSNPNCGTSGFSAVPGWDPVTGLGTPKFEKLLELWLALP
jgi:tripeptidyl-peptidase-1